MFKSLFLIASVTLSVQAMEIKKAVLPDINRETEISVINYQAKIVPVKKKIVTVIIRKGN